MVEDLKQELFRKGGTLRDWGDALMGGILSEDQQWVSAIELGHEAQETARRIMGRGQLVEYECYDSRGGAQGRAVVKLKDWVEYASAMFQAEHLIASDGYYEWYAKQSLKDDKGVYHICGSRRRSCKEKLGRGDNREVVHVEKWRMMTPLMMIQSDYTARLGREALAEYVRNFAPRVPEPAAPPAGGGAPPGARPPGSGADAALERLGNEEDAQKEAGAKSARSAAPPKVKPKGSVGALLEKKVAEHRAALKEKESKEAGKERGRSRSRRRRKRRRSKSSGDSRSKSSGSSRESFRMPSARGEDELWRRSRRHPGKLLQSGMQELQRFLANRTEAAGEGDGHWTEYKMMGYINQVILSQHPQATMGIRNYRELITLGNSIDLLLSGRLPELGDLLMQRLRALEAALNEQSWQTARHLELIPVQGASLTSEVDRRRAAKQEMSSLKLREMTQKSRKGGTEK